LTQQDLSAQQLQTICSIFSDASKNLCC